MNIRARARAFLGALAGAALVAGLSTGGLAGQEATVRIAGVVTARESGAPLEGVRVWVEGTSRGATTDARGAFAVTGVPAGRWLVVIEMIGRATERREVDATGGGPVRLDVALAERAVTVAPVVVSTTRETQALSRTAASVDVVDGASIRRRRAAHPSELLGQVPGAWVNVTGGEGHMTAIRQPLTTDPVYLYLEDGVPTRSTGFFNHNALYEVDLAQAQRVEVVKGPATALYGSDAIGGTINVRTRPAVAAPGLEASLEGGSGGYGRLIASWAGVGERDGVRASVNLTRSEGWREATGYDRQSGTVRWDRSLDGGASLRTVATISRIDQQTAGASRLGEAGYRETPERNTTPISFRRVLAARLSTAWERRSDRTLVSVTPFARYNAMDLLPNWSLPYDPAISETANASAGMLAKVRHDFARLDARVIAGVDLDWSPGHRFERRIAPVNEGGVWVRYEEGAPIYDYDVTFAGVSPYLHAEASPVPALRLTAGARFDHLSYDYETRLEPLATGAARRPASTEVSFRRLSPKLGATVALGPDLSAFASYSEGLRVPSESQLFRQGPAEETVGLEPVVARSWEAGLRGLAGRAVRWELAAYRMAKRNDILTYQRPDDARETQNAGATLHRGVELGVTAALPAGLTLDGAWSWAVHRYERWAPAPGVDYAGHEMEIAPRLLGTTSLRWSREAGGAGAGVEWVHLGPYWLDAENTARYAGHDLLNLRAQWAVGDVTLFGRVTNFADARYAESAAWSAVRGRELAPGQPRALHIGAELRVRGDS